MLPDLGHIRVNGSGLAYLYRYYDFLPNTCMCINKKHLLFSVEI